MGATAALVCALMAVVAEEVAVVVCALMPLIISWHFCLCAPFGLNGRPAAAAILARRNACCSAVGATIVGKERGQGMEPFCLEGRSYMGEIRRIHLEFTWNSPVIRKSVR